MVRRTGAETGPGIVYARVGENGRDSYGCLIEALDGLRVGALIESGFFEGRAEQDAAVGARDDVNVGGTDDVTDDRRGIGGGGLRDDADHLAFDGAGGNGEWCNFGGPGSGAVDDGWGAIGGVRGANTNGAATGGEDFEGFGPGGEVNGALPAGFGEDAAEGAGIDGEFGQVPRGRGKLQRGLEALEFARVERTHASMGGSLVLLEGGDDAGIAEISRVAGFGFEFADEIRIERGARIGQRLQHGGGVRVAAGDHASGSVSGFAGGLVAFDDEDRAMFVAQAEGERKADDPGAENDDVPVLHVAIVEQAAGVVLKRRGRYNLGEMTGLINTV